MHVPSGKMTICGHLPLDVALLLISLMVFCRELGSSLDTNTGCVKAVNAAETSMKTLSETNCAGEKQASIVHCFIYKQFLKVLENDLIYLSNTKSL